MHLPFEEAGCPLLAFSPSNARCPLDPWEFVGSVSGSVLLGTAAGLMVLNRGIFRKRGGSPGLAGALGLIIFLLGLTAASLLMAMKVLAMAAPPRQPPIDREGIRRLTDQRPRVVAMVPTRSGLHPGIVRRAEKSLLALETSNPTLNLTIFIFNKTANVYAYFDYVLWIDSDLGVSAPLVLLEEPGPHGTDQFYDTTAFVLQGRSNVSDDRAATFVRPGR
ncbi:hypothetical protein T484DRAFT_1796667 [Baffinella frigidus]|nr:hypothetical protein T484DRAFT_1796667 [Cryptophyta sp. CCMP2293]